MAGGSGTGAESAGALVISSAKPIDDTSRGPPNWTHTPTLASCDSASPHFSPGGGMIAQGFGVTRNFLKERNNSAYFRLKKTPCGFKQQARARHTGEKCGLARMCCVDRLRSPRKGDSQSQLKLKKGTVRYRVARDMQRKMFLASTRLSRYSWACDERGHYC